MKRTLLYALICLLIIFLIVVIFPKRKITNYPSNGTDIVAFGDSLVRGVGSSGGGDFVSILSGKIGKPIINLGRPGDTTYDGLSRLNELDQYKPKVVLLLFGGNDYLKKIPSSETEVNLVKIIRDIHARGSVVILLGVRGGILNDPFDEMYERVSDSMKTALVPNVLRGLIFNSNYMSDAVHPNNAGYALIAEKIYPTLERVLR